MERLRGVSALDSDGSRLRALYDGGSVLRGAMAYRVLLGAIVLGVLLRVVLIGISYGSNDMTTWIRFADFIRADGIWNLYRYDQGFNHPPLMGWMAAGLRTLALWTGIPFPVLFKLPCLIGDVLVMVVLWRCWRESGHIVAAAAAALFSCNPISILVTAYHGNTDSLVGAFGLFAAFAMSRHRYATAGLLVALAANVKIVGVLWAPALFFLCYDRRAMSRFVFGIGVGMLPFVLPLLIAPAEFHRNVLSYGSAPRNWGISRLIGGGVGQLKSLSAELHTQFLAWGRYLTVAGILSWAIFGRIVHLDPFRAGALAFAAFLTLAPGFGIQYLVWIVPVLAAVSLRYSLRYALLGGLFALLVYLTWLTGDWPLSSRHRGIPAPAWVVGLFVWATLVSFQWQVLRSVLLANRRE